MAEKFITDKPSPPRKESGKSILSDENLVLIITTVASSIGGTITLPLMFGPIFGEGPNSIILSIAGALIGAAASIVTNLKRRTKSKQTHA